ncbi:hypothetical protein ACFX2I_006802 [Malus domestica]
MGRFGHAKLTCCCWDSLSQIVVVAGAAATRKPLKVARNVEPKLGSSQVEQPLTTKSTTENPLSPARQDALTAFTKGHVLITTGYCPEFEASWPMT